MDLRNRCLNHDPVFFGLLLRRFLYHWFCKSVYFDEIGHSELTSSSPQWWSSRSTTAHIVFDMRSLIWGFCWKLCDCSSHKFKAANLPSNVSYWNFCRPPTVLLQSERDTFRAPPVWRFVQTWGLGDRPFDSFPVTYMVYLLPFLSYLAGSESVSVHPPVRPHVRPGYDDKYHSVGYRFVEQQ